MNYHLKKLDGACHKVSDMLYYILQKYSDELISHLDQQCPFLDQWNLAEIIPKKDCFLQVQTLVFRVAYPLANSLIRWPIYTSEREITIKELYLVCPEIFYLVDETTKEKIIKIPNGMQGIIQIARTMNLLPDNKNF